MKRHLVKKTILALALACGLAGLATTAWALWSANDATPVPPFDLGTVQFGASTQSEAPTAQYSPDGGPVTLTLPGSEIVKVLDQTGLNPPPVIWRFTVEGRADGITGLNLDVSLGAQLAKNGTVTDLASGRAAPGTILAFSTLTVYPAALNGDCSAVPADPSADPGANIHLVDNTDHVLLSPGAGEPTTQTWCVALNFNNAPDAAYANEVTASGTAEDDTRHSAIDAWGALVAFPPSLDPLGTYVNRASVTATAEDGSTSRDDSTWEGAVYPDPRNEPDVTILVDPTVTNLNPSVPPGDHATLPTTSPTP